MRFPGGPWPVRVGVLLGLLVGAPLLVRAAEPVPPADPADDDFLEFLGSVDSDDEGWKQYLARTGTPAPAAKPPPAPPPSSAPGKDDAKDEH